MKLKPPTLRKHKLRSLVALGVLAAGVSGLALTSATPAFADPTENLVAVGSDTIQDVYNSFAFKLGGNALASYNAVNPVTGDASGSTTGTPPAQLLTPVDGSAATSGSPAGVNCSFSRPNGSGPGIAALEAAEGQADPGVTAPAPTAGCVDIARSSSAPGADNSGVNEGDYTGANPNQYVPFALDAVTGAIGPATGGTVGGVATVATVLPATVEQFTVTELQSLYNCQPTPVGSTTFWPYDGNPADLPSGDQRIDLYIPQLGSGTEKFWVQTTLGLSASAPPACDNHTIVNGTLTGTAVEEHDGTAVATDPYGYGPFSIAQWVSQSNGHNDRRHGAVLQDINGEVPLVGGVMNTGQNGAGTAFPITRFVFSVVAKSRLDSATDPIHSLLLGTTSFVCRDKADITGYGFALINSACGEELSAYTTEP